MDAYVADWLNLLLRWLHLIAGIAWIGASFYFVWLDNSLRPPAPGSDLERQGVAGELWAVHGGGFYNPQKYLVAPASLPAELHWFKWEAYTTWLSGFALLVVAYYWNARAMLIDPAVADLGVPAAIGIGMAALVVAWAVYDGLCRSPLGRRPLLMAVLLYAFFLGAAFVLGRLLSGRAAYLHVGAMMGTVMAANVLMVIIPGQRRMVAAMRAGRAPDPADGRRGKQRSVHNNYLTLPVLFVMISNHYAMTYNHRYAWAVLGALALAGVSIRHFFNLRHRGRLAWQYLAAGGAILIAVAVAIAPSPARHERAAVRLEAVQAVMAQRCVQCHAERPTHAGFAQAPAGVRLDNPQDVRRHAERLYRQVVLLKAMPIGNLTAMTEAERSLIAQWYGQLQQPAKEKAR
jgi:uncharacterized membrane protein